MKVNSMKTIGRRLTCLFFILCAAVSTISAQTYQLSGCVQDENNQPVEVANVLLEQAKDSTYVTGMLTDAQGCFSFTQLKGEYQLHITFIGCEDIYLPVSLQGDKNVGILRLKSSSTFLNEVTVTAARPIIIRTMHAVAMRSISCPGMVRGILLRRTGSITVQILTVLRSSARNVSWPYPLWAASREKQGILLYLITA